MLKMYKFEDTVIHILNVYVYVKKRGEEYEPEVSKSKRAIFLVEGRVIRAVSEPF